MMSMIEVAKYFLTNMQLKVTIKTRSRGNCMVKKMRYTDIWVHGAREHNLKNIDVRIPKNTLTVITGPSGSGKSSLARDVLYAEGQRRYMESLSLYARQFLGMPRKPDYDRIEGLTPTVIIDQKTVGSNPRSTVGTITEMYDYLRILFARLGTQYCPDCMKPVERSTSSQVRKLIESQYAGNVVMVTASLVREQKGEFVHVLQKYIQQGFNQFIIDGKRERLYNAEDASQLQLKKTYKHTIDCVVDIVDLSEDIDAPRLAEAIEKALQLGGGTCKVVTADGREQLFATDRVCTTCHRSFAALEPRTFSFNSPVGACSACQGLGIMQLYQEEESWYTRREEMPCDVCAGKRLHADACAVRIQECSIYDVGQMSIADAATWFDALVIPDDRRSVVTPVIGEITHRLTFLQGVGLDYLSLNRTARTLSGGESQRIRLARQLGTALSGVTYILDEPSIGLHQRDNDRLIETLKRLRDLDNTIIVVEHDLDTIRAADHVIDMGKGAGVHGGSVVASATPAALVNNEDSITARYISGKESIELPATRRAPLGEITVHDATANNLKHVSVSFPLGVFIGVSGVSGSGKSSLIMHELVPALQGTLSKKQRWQATNLTGVEQLENSVVINQSPIGRTPRSNLATYLGIFDEVRALFAQLPESQVRGYKVGRFSFNVKGGRCERCSGEGAITVSMHFLPDVTMPCKACNGARYNEETLSVRYKGKTIADILTLTVEEAAEFFAHHRRIVKRLQLLLDVGLGYLTLGQPATTLSGGEAQRIKLVNELAKRGTRTFYVLDEPTTGLHSCDIKRLLQVLQRLVDKGNTVLVIEHNLDVLKVVDHLIDLGPEGGYRGGYVIAQGTPDVIAATPASETGRYLASLLSQ